MLRWWHGWGRRSRERYSVDVGQPERGAVSDEYAVTRERCAQVRALDEDPVRVGGGDVEAECGE